MNIKLTNIAPAAVFPFASLFMREEFFEIKKQRNKNKLNEMESNFCVEKNIDFFHKTFRYSKQRQIK